MIVHMDGNVLRDVQLKIFEPPRFFEAFLRDRSFMEAPDITARICGICPVAYQMSSIQAMEQALNVKVSDGIRDLRRLMYCGEPLYPPPPMLPKDSPGAARRRRPAFSISRKAHWRKAAITSSWRRIWATGTRQS